VVFIHHSVPKIKISKHSMDLFPSIRLSYLYNEHRGCFYVGRYIVFVCYELESKERKMHLTE